MFQLKILWKRLDLGKCRLVSERKHLPTPVSKFLLYGGLYQMMFHGWFLCVHGVPLWDSLYVKQVGVVVIKRINQSNMP